MSGHVTKRGKEKYSFVVDVPNQRAQRCPDRHRTWVDHGKVLDECPVDECGLELGPPVSERRQLWRSGFTTKKAADAAMREFLVELDKGADPFPADITLDDWSARWQASEAFTRLRPRTRARYAQVMRDNWLEQIGDLRVDRIRPRHLRQVLDGMAAGGSSARSVSEGKAIISSCLARAVDVGLIDANPAAGVRTSAGRRRRLTVPEPADVMRLLAEVKDGTWELPTLIAAYTGMRRSEVLGLRWADVDLEGGSISVVGGLHRIKDESGTRLDFLETKTETSERTFTISGTLLSRLTTARRDHVSRRVALGPTWRDLDLVCDRGDGGPLDPDAFSHGFARAVEAVGLPKGTRLHDLRHAVATTLLAQSVDAKIVSAMLGHSTVAFTQDQYQHVLKEMTDPAAAAMDAALGGQGL